MWWVLEEERISSSYTDMITHLLDRVVTSLNSGWLFTI